ncbi:hypothetical protein HYQ46_006609 [Verticillium longisporum]|nr:hypothetical protein HYQ46_006609 [Verticillium longisporum]
MRGLSKGIHQVHLKKASLQLALLRAVLLQSIQEEGSSLLDHALGLEDVHHPRNIYKRAALVVGERGGELGALLGVDANNVLQQLHVVCQRQPFGAHWPSGTPPKPY